MLHRIVRSGRELVDADYAALAVVGPNRQLGEFVHVHVLDADGTRAPVAVGDAVPTPLVLCDFVERPRSFGVPPGRPRMSVLLTVPVQEDRDRIARDLHDLVVQRLFAISLGVQSLARLAGPGVIADRASGFVTDLDHTVREIRRSIFSLHEIPEGAVSLRGDLLRVVKEAAGMLGFRPRVDLLGALDSLVPDDVRPDLLAAVREALSNVARHAAASAVWVEVEVGQRRWPAAPARQG